MSLKLFAVFNTLGVIGWLPILGISFFFWEDAGNPLMLLALVAMYGGMLLSVVALLISVKNISSSLNGLSTGSKSLVWLGTLASIGGFVFLFYIKTEVW